MMLPQYYQGQPLNSYAYPQMQYGMSSPAPSPQQVGMQQSVKKPPTANGPQSAMQYPMGPNEISPAIFDETEDVFYLIATDGMGTKSCKAYDFTERLDRPSPPAPTPVTREDMDALVARVDAIEGRINGTDGQDQGQQPA